MDYGLCLPNFPAGASPEGIDAATEVAERLGMSTVWTTDHVLVPHDAAADYGRIYEAILTLAWVGARHPRVRLATSVIVVPQRNAIVLAKELATLDSLSGGRVTAGVGIGWNAGEFANLAVADRFHVRGAYLDETIRLWRHLWSGSTEPFRGRFHTIEDFAFGPLPVQEPLPIVIGGRAEPALRRAGTLARRLSLERDSARTAYAARIPIVAAAAAAAGRPTPSLSARVRVELRRGGQRRGVRDARRPGRHRRPRSGRGPRSASTHLALYFDTHRPGGARRARRALRSRGRTARLSGLRGRRLSLATATPQDPRRHEEMVMGDKTPKRPPKPKKPKAPTT